MKYIEVQKKLIKKTITFDKYTLKSGLLDLLCFLLFFVMLMIVFASFQQFATSMQLYEQDYSEIQNDPTLSESFKQEVGDDYVDNLKILMNVIVISVIALVLLSFLFGNFIKIIQYNYLKKSVYKTTKQYFKVAFRTLINTLPYFLVLWGIIFGLIFVFGLVLSITIICFVIFLIYYAYLPILRLSSMKNLKFKKTWKEFFIFVKKSAFFMPFVKLSVIVGIILFILLTWLTLLIQGVFVNIIVSLLQIALILFLFIYLRKYLFILFWLICSK